MTIAEQLTHEIESLSVTKQRQALRLIRSLRAPALQKPRKTGNARKAEIHASLRAITGMWKDHTDLPKDAVAASVVLRRRVMGRDEDTIDKRTLHPAVRAIAGMWKDRTDLPEDSVEAVKVIRARMKSRARKNA